MRLQSRIQRSSAPVFFLFLFGVSSCTLLHSSTGASAAAAAPWQEERETHTWPQQQALCPVCCWCTWYLSSVLVHLDPSQAVVVVVGFRSREREEVCTKYYISYCEIQEWIQWVVFCVFFRQSSKFLISFLLQWLQIESALACMFSVCFCVCIFVCDCVCMCGCLCVNMCVCVCVILYHFSVPWRQLMLDLSLYCYGNACRL